MYVISEYSKNQAARLKVQILPSTRKNKKIDVYKDGEYVASIGDSRYYDLPHYMRGERQGQYPKGTAKRARYLYWKRHAKDIAVEGSPGWLAANLLW